MASVSPPIYETHFFNSNASFVSNWYRGRDWYEGKLASLNRTLVGGKSPDYLCDPLAPVRIHAWYPHVQIVVFLRDPVSRLYSHWNMVRHHDRSNSDPLPSPPVIDPTDPCGYVHSRLYAEHLKRYALRFPRTQIHVFVYEELHALPKEHEYDEVFRAIGAT